MQSHTKLCWAAALTSQLRDIFLHVNGLDGALVTGHANPSLASSEETGSSEIVLTSIWKNDLDNFAPSLFCLIAGQCRANPLPCFAGDAWSQDSSSGEMAQSGKCFIIQPRGSEFNFQHPCKKAVILYEGDRDRKIPGDLTCLSV